MIETALFIDWICGAGWIPILIIFALLAIFLVALVMKTKVIGFVILIIIIIAAALFFGFIDLPF